MFSKLLKWDFRSHLPSIFIMVFSLLACFIFTLLARLDISILSGVTLFIAVLMTMGAVAFTLLRIPYLIAKDIYSNVGYRTNMIPVKTSTLWHSKIVVGFIFTLLAIGLFFLNFSVINYFAPGGQGDFFAQISEGFNHAGQVVAQVFGLSQGFGKFIIIFSVLFTILLTQFSFGFYIALSNSKLFNRQGGIRYLLGYVLYYLFIQFIGLLGLFLFPLNGFFKNVDGVVRLVPEFKSFITLLRINRFENGISFEANYFPIGLLVVTTIVLIAQYFITRKMMDKHLNI